MGLPQSPPPLGVLPASHPRPDDEEILLLDHQRERGAIDCDDVLCVALFLVVRAIQAKQRTG